MGQAKRRGTYEQRRLAAIKRDEEYRKNHPIEAGRQQRRIQPYFDPLSYLLLLGMATQNLDRRR